jgi:predicted permease
MRRDRLERGARRVYRALMTAYPQAFRDVMGDDVEETFVDRLRDARAAGVVPTLLFLVSALTDVVVNGIRERLISPFWSSPMFYWQDVRYAFRLLRKSLALTLLTVCVLGGGLGVAIFTFSFLHTAMLRPIPVSGGDRIVRVSESAGTASIGIDAADLAQMRASITTLTDIGSFDSRELVVGNEKEGGRHVVNATAADWNIFEMTRTRAALGRAFRPDDAARGAEPVLVLSHRAFTTSFGSDSSLVGRVVAVNGTPTRIIGVMPAGYAFPVASEGWIPLGAGLQTYDKPGVIRMDLYGRLANGATIASAEAQLEALSVRVRASRPAPVADPSRPQPQTAPLHISVETFPRAQLGEEGPLMFAVLNVLAALILLLACVNVMNLLLARANDRAREMAVRLALGASRARLMIQSLWESAILTIAGGVLATVITAWGLSTINAWAQAHIPGNLAFWWVWRFDQSAFLATGVFVTLTLAALGGVVAARATNVQINAVLQDTSVRGGGKRQSRMARGLVVTQVATVSVLMFFGVMSSIIANRVTHVDLGYDTRNLMSTGVTPTPDRYDTPAKRLAFYRLLDDALEQAPELAGVAIEATVASLGAASASDAMVLEGRAQVSDNAAPRAYVRVVQGSLGVLGTGVSTGRAFDGRDNEHGARSVIVSSAFAARYWPGMSPIGRQLRLSGLSETVDRTVVGVARDVPLGNPLSRDRSMLAVYVPLAQFDVEGASLVFRHRGSTTAGIAAVHRTFAAIDPTYVPSNVATYDEILETTALMARSVTKLFALCFGFALLLAVSGTYGLMAQSIGQRTREIGIRRALGATDRGIVRLLLGQGGRQLGVGAAIALPLLLMVGIGFSHYFPIGTALSVVTGLVVSGTIIGVVLAATYLPTRRVLRVSPRQALWGE